MIAKVAVQVRRSPVWSVELGLCCILWGSLCCSEGLVKIGGGEVIRICDACDVGSVEYKVAAFGLLGFGRISLMECACLVVSVCVGCVVLSDVGHV